MIFDHLCVSVCVCTISQGFTEPENGQWLCSFTYILSDDNIIISTVDTISKVWRWCHRGDCMGKKTVCVCVCTRTYVCNNHEDIYHRLWYEVTKFFHATPPPTITGYYMNQQANYQLRLTRIRCSVPPPPPSTFPQDL